MTGNIANAIGIILGGLIGLFLKRFIKDSYSESIMNGIGISVVVIGITSTIKSENMLLIVISIVLGTLLGEIVDIETKLNKLGVMIGSKFQNSDNSSFSKAFVTTTLIYCVGAMAILGALESGLKGDHTTLYTKSILDGITAVIFASTMGIGVIFSSIPVFLYQGTIVLLASVLKEVFTDELILELSAVGGIMIIAIGLNILQLKKIKIGNMLPALLVPIVYFFIKN